MAFLRTTFFATLGMSVSYENEKSPRSLQAMCSSGRGECCLDVEVVATKAYQLIFFCSLLIIFP